LFCHFIWTASEIGNTENIEYPDPERNAVNPNEKTTQLARKSSTGPPTLEQPQHLASSSLEAHGVSPLQKATFAVLGRPASSQVTHERNPAQNERITQLEWQLAVSLSVQTERDQRIARLTDELALKSALLEQVKANATEGKRRARLELREHEDRLLAQTSLVDMQSKLKNTEAMLDELLPELVNVRAELEAKKSELEAVRLRLTDAEDGWAKSKAKADVLRTVTAASLVDLNEDQAMYELKERHVMEAESASLQWNEESIYLSCRGYHHRRAKLDSDI
jgi:hypothetical protein